MKVTEPNGNLGHGLSNAVNINRWKSR